MGGKRRERRGQVGVREKRGRKGLLNLMSWRNFQFVNIRCSPSSVVAVYPSPSVLPPTPRIRWEVASDTTAVIGTMQLLVSSITDPSLFIE